MPRLLLLLPTTTYRTDAFLAAAARLDVDVTVASEEPNTLSDLNPAALLTLDFDNPSAAARKVVAFASEYPLDGVVAVDSQVTAVAAAIATELQLPCNPLDSVLTASNKFLVREALQRARVPSPDHRLCRFDDELDEVCGEIEFPAVVKPLSLASSQGVMRVDDRSSLEIARDRLQQILRRVATRSADEFLVEQFVKGPEVALEGILTDGRLQVLALMDKPDAMDGPFFEETIYTTPSRHSHSDQEAVAKVAQAASEALGLKHGPVHIELRLTASGPVVIEVNPRSIGGLCSKVLRFGTGLSLEELILRHHLQRDWAPPRREKGAVGVMMIPIPSAGRLEEVKGLEEAQQTPGIDQVVIGVHPGKQLVPLPEGSEYLGFIFSRGETVEHAEQALRNSHACLQFQIV